MQAYERKCCGDPTKNTKAHVNKRSPDSFRKSIPDKTQAVAHSKPCTSVGEVAGQLPGHGIERSTRELWPQTWPEWRPVRGSISDVPSRSPQTCTWEIRSSA